MLSLVSFHQFRAVLWSFGMMVFIILFRTNIFQSPCQYILSDGSESYVHLVFSMFRVHMFAHLSGSELNHLLILFSCCCSYLPVPQGLSVCVVRTGWFTRNTNHGSLWSNIYRELIMSRFGCEFHWSLDCLIHCLSVIYLLFSRLRICIGAVLSYVFALCHDLFSCVNFIPFTELLGLIVRREAKSDCTKLSNSDCDMHTYTYNHTHAWKTQ